MGKIVFLKMDGDDQVEMRMGTDLTWTEVTERFVQFLQGVGYQVSAQDVGEYLTEITADYTGGDQEDDFSTINISTTGDTDTVSIYTTDSSATPSFTTFNLNEHIMSSTDFNNSTITVTSGPLKYSFDDLTTATNNWFTAPKKD